MYLLGQKNAACESRPGLSLALLLVCLECDFHVKLTFMLSYKLDSSSSVIMPHFGKSSHMNNYLVTKFIVARWLQPEVCWS